MNSIFTYGSLMYDSVWQRVVNHRYEMQNGQLKGYIRRSVIDEEYPVIIKGQHTDFVTGVLYESVDDVAVARLDKFEGAYYSREQVSVLLAGGKCIQSEVYVLKDEYRHIMLDKAWDQTQFEAEGIHAFLRAYWGFTPSVL